MSREWRLYLEDMRNACLKVREYAEGMSQAEFLADSRTYDAVVRNLEILGEAARKVPPEIRRIIPEIDWNRISGMRNVLAHAYFGIDNDILWDVIQNHAPRLLSEVERFLGQNPPPPNP